MSRPRTWAGVGAGVGVVALLVWGWTLGAKAPPEASGAAARATPPPSSSPAANTARPATPTPALAPDTAVWKVTVHPDDPSLGPKDALVTVVVFSEFECVPCRDSATMLKEILAAYPNDLRVVWKDNPLPFSERAKPAAMIARFVEHAKGPRAFWDAHDRLFALRSKLGDDELRTVTDGLGLRWNDVKDAIGRERFMDVIDRGVELGADVKVRGTPHFFINGRRLPGAQGIDKFKPLIERELAAAKALVASGVPREKAYETIIARGEEAPPLEKRDVAPPDPASPVRGEPGAKIVLQQWAEFPCRKCSRAMRTLHELEGEYQGKLKIVWRYLSPSTVATPPLVAQIAQAVFTEGDASSFWAFHDRVLDAETREGELKRDALERIARESGVDTARLKRALDSGKPNQRILADTALAAKAGIAVSPSFVINGYFLTGDPPWAVFKKAINRALRDAGAHR
jgi:protein-disulfide isomerase